MDTEPHVRPLGGGRAARIDDVQARPVLDPLEEMMKPDRMRLTGVRAPEEDEVGMLRFLVRARRASSPQDCRQTDDARSVSGSIAAVDVVVPEYRPRELRRQEVDLVCRLRAAKDSGRRPSMPGQI